jgi:glycosyltransferase involved in cell wall biosynthesis
MDYYPNQQAIAEFCKQTLPLLRARRPALQLVIVGANPSRRVRRLDELPGVTVTGSVPDVRPYVYRSAANVAPLLIARGTQNKILESMAMGVPVVASEQAAGGVDAIPGEHFLAASTPDGYADAILRLLENPAEHHRFARAGRARMLSHHNWQGSMERLSSQIADYLPASGR